MTNTFATLVSCIKDDEIVQRFRVDYASQKPGQWRPFARQTVTVLKNESRT
jgi:hypothetical protein